MFLARVIGTVVATVRDPGLKSLPLLLVQPLTHKREDKGQPVIVTDRVGVGPGEEVFCEVSTEAALGLPWKLVPTDASIVGRVDAVELSHMS